VNPFAARFLYGLDAPLPREMVEAYLRALVVVARANGVVESESSFIQGVAEVLGAPPFSVSRALREATESSLEPSLAVLRERPVMVALLYRDAILVARADGRETVDEQQLLIQISTMLGLDRSQRQRAVLAADALGELRRGIRSLVAETA
jgi:tellurite resistance protein